MDDDDDWGLHAVVRGCSSSAVTAAAADNNPSFPIFPPAAPRNTFDFLTDDVSEDRFQGLQDVYRELCGGSPPPPPPAAIAAHDVYQHRQQIMETKSPQRMMMMNNNVQSQQENMRFSNPRLGGGGSSSHNSPAANPQPNRQRRRKNQQTKIIRQMTQEELSADSWAWRKYGQKPIKGSPYPRNYYRCSTSKGCAARKQVERSPNDAETFVVSYSGEHTHPRPTHRSSLSGSTRAKLSSPPPRRNINADNKKGLNISSSSSPAAAAAGNDDVEMAEEDGGDEEEEEENIFMISNDLAMNHDDEDLFKGFRDCDDLDGSGGGGDFFRSGLRSSPTWTSTSAAAFHGGGGG